MELARATLGFADHRHSWPAQGSRNGCGWRCGCYRRASARGLGRGLCAAALRHRRRGLRGAVPRGAGQHRSGSGQLALCARCRRSGASAGRIHRHPYHGALQQRQRGCDALVLSPARRGDHQPRRAPLVSSAGRGDTCGVCGRSGRRAGRGGRGHTSRHAHYGRRLALADARCADDSPGREAALRRRRGLDQEAARRPDSRRRGRRTDSRVPAPQRRVAGKQQVAGGPEGGRPARGSPCFPSSRT